MPDLTELEQHEFLMAGIKELPIVNAIRSDLTRNQKLYLEDQKARWIWIGERLSYLRGYRAEDPLKSIPSPELEVLVKIQADLYLDYLDLIIKGFEIIRDSAHKDEKAFPFRFPMELLLEVLKEHADCSHIFLDEPETNKKELYSEGQRWVKFLTYQLDKPEEEGILKELKSIGWHGYWLACLWSYPHKQRDFRREWKSLIKNYRSLIHQEKRYSRKTSKRKYLFNTLNWRNGIPFSSQNRSPVGFQRQSELD